MQRDRAALLPVVDTARCTGCGWCVASCPYQLLSLERQGWRKVSVLHGEARCTGCRKCERKCPFGVIAMQPTGAAPPPAGAESPA